MVIRLLSLLALLVICFSQDALISPKESYTISINTSHTYSQSYLIEINPQSFMAEWATIVAHYHSLKPSAIIQASFSAVYKQDPNHVWSALAKCRFEGATAQWCKVGQRSPPFNLHHHLLKVQLQCPTSCEAQLLIGFTQTAWDSKTNPKFIGGPVPNMGPFITKKSEAFMKIIGWMLFTLLAVLGAIKLATNLADRLDNKPPRSYSESKEE